MFYFDFLVAHFCCPFSLFVTKASIDPVFSAKECQKHNRHALRRNAAVIGLPIRDAPIPREEKTWENAVNVRQYDEYKDLQLSYTLDLAKFSTKLDFKCRVQTSLNRFHVQNVPCLIQICLNSRVAMVPAFSTLATSWTGLSAAQVGEASLLRRQRTRSTKSTLWHHTLQADHSPHLAKLLSSCDSHSHQTQMFAICIACITSEPRSSCNWARSWPSTQECLWQALRSFKQSSLDAKRSLLARYRCSMVLIYKKKIQYLKNIYINHFKFVYHGCIEDKVQVCFLSRRQTWQPKPCWASELSVTRLDLRRWQP